MKKTFLVAFLFVSQFGMAMSPFNVRLQFANKALGRGPVLGVRSETLQVIVNGTVIYQPSCVISYKACKSVEVARLNAYEMDKIEGLIDDAAKGKLVTLPIRAMCIRLPSTVPSYTADNERILLREGSVCSGITVNDAEAAKQLVTKIQAFLQQGRDKLKVEQE